MWILFWVQSKLKFKPRKGAHAQVQAQWPNKSIENEAGGPGQHASQLVHVVWLITGKWMIAPWMWPGRQLLKQLLEAHFQDKCLLTLPIVTRIWSQFTKCVSEVIGLKEKNREKFTWFCHLTYPNANFFCRRIICLEW